MSTLQTKEYKQFEDIKHVREDGSEFWYARELTRVLDYTQWRNFQAVIKRAMIACENSSHNVVYDFAEVSKIVNNNCFHRWRSTSVNYKLINIIKHILSPGSV